MKKTILCILVIFITQYFQLKAQQWQGNNNQTDPISREGAIQVGHWMGSSYLGNAYGQGMNWGTGYLGFNAWRDGTDWRFGGDGTNNGCGIIFGDAEGSIHFVAIPSNVFVSNGQYGSITEADVLANERLSISWDNGKIKMGDVETPDGYRLFVQDGVLTERIKVALHNTNDWMDKVFNEDYQLMPLEKVKDFIEKEKHLPDMPSACQLVEDGEIDLKEMITLQQQKIEELYLHIIELNRKLQELSSTPKK